MLAAIWAVLIGVFKYIVPTVTQAINQSLQDAVNSQLKQLGSEDAERKGLEINEKTKVDRTGKEVEVNKLNDADAAARLNVWMRD